MSGERLACEAIGLIGTPFRLHGRDPRTGLDCVGLLEVVLRRTGHDATLPNGYSLRSRSEPDFARIASLIGLVVARDAERIGDVIVCCPSVCQLHLVIACGAAAHVHAHAGLRRVVAIHGKLPWPERFRCRLPNPD